MRWTYRHLRLETPSWRSAIPEMTKINWKRPVRIAFDSDVVIKHQVLDFLRNLTEHIVGDFYPDDPGLSGHIPHVVFLPSELD